MTANMMMIFDNRFKLDDTDQAEEDQGDVNLMEVVQGRKKMTGRAGLNTAQKNIPMISKPGI